jgi:aspartyl-tRNA(Asn)/glutamyl-tRNA(Gln) amidotransferase subunit A
MPSYNLSVQDFLAKSKQGSLDYLDFAAALLDETQKLNKKFSFFREINDFRKGLNIASPLFGLPVTAKDNICVRGLQATAGSKVLEGYAPPFDSTAIARCKDDGAVILGKTNQDEFGFGTFCTNSGYQVPKNPLDPSRVTGGSSGGAAGLTAALNMPHIALGQSTGGSISCPAAWCAVVGLTPTYGLVSRYGLIDYANSLDKIGPIARSVHDVALLLSVIAGHDPRDSTSLQHPRHDYTQFASRRELHGIKIGIPKEYMEGLSKEVEKEFLRAIEELEGLGAACKDISLPHTPYALPAYYIIATAEASTNLAKYCGMRYGLHLNLTSEASNKPLNFNEYFGKVRAEGLGEEAKRRVMLGTFARMSGYREAFYLRAMKIRTLVIQDFKKTFAKFDLLAAPTMPILPPKFSEVGKLEPTEVYAMDTLTVPPNLAGMPHLSLPVKPRTPIGLHLIADHLQEGRLIEAAAAYEAAA